MTAQRRARPGFSLIETILSLTLLTVVVGALFGLVVNVQRGYTVQQESLRAEETLRTVELTLRTVLRSAGADPLATGQALLDPDPLGHGRFDNLRVRADHNPPDGDFADEMEDVRVRLQGGTVEVQWQAGAAWQPIAEPVASLAFEYFDDNGSPCTTAAQLAAARRVRIVVEAPDRTRPGALFRRESWVFLRNR